MSFVGGKNFFMNAKGLGIENLNNTFAEVPNKPLDHQGQHHAG